MEPVSSRNNIDALISTCSIHIGQLKAGYHLSEEVWSIWSKLRSLLEQKHPSAQPSDIKQTFEKLKSILIFTQLSNPSRAAFYALEQAATSRFNISLKARNVRVLSSQDEELCSPASIRTRWDAQAWQMQAHL
jgi:hypothetical protein